MARFALTLFSCRDEPRSIGGIHFDGTLKASPVQVFDHWQQYMEPCWVCSEMRLPWTAKYPPLRRPEAYDNAKRLLERSFSMSESKEESLEYPDARIEVAVVCENHELLSGVTQLNPLLKQILEARSKSGQTVELRPQNPHFGRLRFSQHLR
jgi:hypothetical protein